MRPINWYILHTAYKAEKVVDKRLSANGIEAFLPLFSSQRHWSDRTKVLELPLFPQLVFVHCNDFRLRTLSTFPGVVRVVKFNDRPATISPSEMDMIREFSRMAQDNEVITEAQARKECPGPIEKQSGKITVIGNKIAYLYFESFESTTYIKLLNKQLTL